MFSISDFIQFDEKDPEILGEYCYYDVGFCPGLIHRILEKNGIMKTEDPEKACVFVGSSTDNSIYSTLLSWQMTTRFMNTFSICSKGTYHRSMFLFSQRTGKWPCFYPKSYILPFQKDEFLNNYENGVTWIAKPINGSCGRGIFLFNSLGDVCLDEKIVVQQYITNPILYHGLKFDIRFYVALTSVDPLCIYIYDNGLVRLASENYPENFSNLSNLSAHLTNFSVNKVNDHYVSTNEMSLDGTGNKWTHKSLWKYLDSIGFDKRTILNRVENAIITVFIAARESLISQKKHRQSKELYGFDILLDSCGSVYILEVNVSPSMGTSSKLDREVKTPLVKDFFNMLLIPKRKETYQNNGATFPEINLESVASILYSLISLQDMVSGSFRRIFPQKDNIEVFCNKFEKPTELEKIVWTLI